MDATVTPAPIPDPNPNPNPNAAPVVSCWSNIVKKQPDPKPQNSSDSSSIAAGKVFVESCKSSKGIAVVDANAIIQGGETLAHCADKFVSIPEVMDEVRDPVSRHRLVVVPFQVQTIYGTLP